MLCLAAALLLLLATAARGVVVAPASPCAAGCGNVLDSTGPDDVVCSTGAYTGPAGQLFEECVECELRSSFYNGQHSDVYSALYNLRYSLSYCLFGVPHNDHLDNTPCITSKACGPFGDALAHGNLSSRYTSLEYCSKWPLDTDIDYRSCTECLQAADNYYLANFVTILQAGCEQRPAPGVTVGIQGDVFSKNVVNITAPTPTVTVDPAWFDQGPLTLSAKVGIAVGAFVLVLIIVGFAIVWNGKRRRRAFLRQLDAKYAQQDWPYSGGANEKPVDDARLGQQPHGDWGDTPTSQHPLRGCQYSPMTPSTEATYPRCLSPYSSQHNSPINMQPHANPLMPLAGLGLANTGVAEAAQGNGTSWSSGASEGKGKAPEEAYELQRVQGAQTLAPAVVHNGHLQAG